MLFGAGGEDAPLVDVLCATCALPLYYPPVMLGGRRCGDGGLRGVLPLEAAAAVAVEPVVAVDVGPGARPARRARPPASHPLVRAHDEAVGTLMAATHRGAARGLAGRPGAPSADLRPAAGRAQRDLPGRPDAALRRGRLPGRARVLDAARALTPTSFGAN